MIACKNLVTDHCALPGFFQGLRVDLLVGTDLTTRRRCS
jgi:hypothetical protein